MSKSALSSEPIVVAKYGGGENLEERKYGGKKIWREKNMEVAKYEGGERLIGNFYYYLADFERIE